MDKIYSIYKATNRINNKIYVGFDSNWPRRKQQHKSSVDRNTPFAAAIKKYGFGTFDWEVIYQSKDGDHTLHVMENHFIVSLNSFCGSGYNLTLGGDGALGRVDSAETTNRRREAKVNKPRGPMTDEQKLKISSTKIGKPWSELRREVGYAKDAELARLRNPMKDPAKIEKMLNTRKRNKELRMVVN